MVRRRQTTEATVEATTVTFPSLLLKTQCNAVPPPPLLSNKAAKAVAVALAKVGIDGEERREGISATPANDSG